MGLFDQKLDSIAQLKVATALGDGLTSEINQFAALRNTGSFKSLNPSNKDAIEYAIDLMSLLFGADFLEKTVNKVMKRVFRKGPSGKMLLEDKLKTILLDNLCGSDGKRPLPADFLTPGYALPVKVLDLFDVWKLNPVGSSENVLLGDSNGFERMFQASVLQSATSGTLPTTFTSLPGIGFKFSLSNNAVTLTGAVTKTDVTIEDYFRSILYAPGFQLFNPGAIALEVLDIILGFVSPRRTVRALSNEEALRDITDKLANEEAVETVFTFNPKSLADIEARAKKRKLGGYSLDLGCEVTNVAVAEEAIIAALDNQPDYAGMFTEVLHGQLSSDGVELNDAIRENSQRGLLKALVLVLLKNSVFSPRIWTLFVLAKIFKVGYPQSKYSQPVATGLNSVDIHSILSDRASLVAEITSFVRATAMEYITEILMKQIIKLITPVVVQVQKEAAEAYLKIIASLTRLTTFT
jgi:hypothetical protein